MTVFGYPVKNEEGFTITKGKREPEVYESYAPAYAHMRAVYGSILSYRVELDKEEE